MVVVFGEGVCLLDRVGWVVCYFGVVVVGIGCLLL